MVSVGNIILSIQGQDVAGMSAQGLASTIRAFPPGQRIIFHVQRHSLSSFARQQDSSELSNGEFLCYNEKRNTRLWYSNGKTKG